MMKGLEHLFYEERTGTLQPREEEDPQVLPRNLGEDLVNVYKYLNGECRDRISLYSVVSSDRTGANGHNMKHGRFPLNIRKHFFTVRLTEMEEVARRGCEVSLLGDIQKLSGHGSGQLVPGVCLSREIGLDDLQFQPFCVCVSEKELLRLDIE